MGYPLIIAAPLKGPTIELTVDSHIGGLFSLFKSYIHYTIRRCLLQVEQVNFTVPVQETNTIF